MPWLAGGRYSVCRVKSVSSHRRYGLCKVKGCAAADRVDRFLYRKSFTLSQREWLRLGNLGVASRCPGAVATDVSRHEYRSQA